MAQFQTLSIADSIIGCALCPRQRTPPLRQIVDGVPHLTRSPINLLQGRLQTFLAVPGIEGIANVPPGRLRAISTSR